MTKPELAMYANQLSAGRLLPRAIEAGDKVKYANVNPGASYEVIAIHGEKAWIGNGHRGGGWEAIARLSDLTPVPEET